ncbi:hypothetical protein BS50DRAFT_275063 [Corynespora cassiicola Philippines]|uniref:Uncharacterized protein n=1 Tax=Corynespora cassiicola Philippines TaxID=1448308 RepID=A0A2T2P0J9_CORCC|nr:hypothetical protein BS50DRAFT_275063 [Corynespora cassiicola Philippines]
MYIFTTTRVGLWLSPDPKRTGSICTNGVIKEDKKHGTWLGLVWDFPFYFSTLLRLLCHFLASLFSFFLKLSRTHSLTLSYTLLHTLIQPYTHLSLPHLFSSTLGVSVKCGV